MERRRDLVFREVVDHVSEWLSKHGFRLTNRAWLADLTRVRLDCSHPWAPNGQGGALSASLFHLRQRRQIGLRVQWSTGWRADVVPLASNLWPYAEDGTGTVDIQTLVAAIDRCLRDALQAAVLRRSRTAPRVALPGDAAARRCWYFDCQGPRCPRPALLVKDAGGERPRGPWPCREHLAERCPTARMALDPRARFARWLVSTGRLSG